MAEQYPLQRQVPKLVCSRVKDESGERSIKVPFCRDIVQQFLASVET